MFVQAAQFIDDAIRPLVALFGGRAKQSSSKFKYGSGMRKDFFVHAPKAAERMARGQAYQLGLPSGASKELAADVRRARHAMRVTGLKGEALNKWASQSVLSKGMQHNLKESGKMLMGGGLGWYAALQVPMAAFAAGSAPTGHKVSAAVQPLLPMVGLAAGTLVGGPLGGMVGSLVIDTALGEAVGKGIQKFSEFNRSVTRLGVGGQDEDSEMAYTMRQRAAAELSGSLLNARQHFGRESVLMHD